MECCEPVGVIEVSQRLGVKLDTVHKWVQREVLPEPDFTVSGMRAWRWRTILRWAGRTGRITSDELAAAYVELTGEDPLPPRKGGLLPAERASA